MSSTEQVAALITSFNRRDKTLRCLDHLFRMDGSKYLSVYLLDDGSSDGTGDAVRSAFSQVRVFQGDGSYFWSGGMRLLYKEAKKVPYAGYLWLNDDVVLDDDALTRLFRFAADTGGKAILGGSMRYPGSTTASYGGSRRLTLHPTRFAMQQPDTQHLSEVDVMNGNFFFVPKAIAETVGDINEQLLQQGADYEYSHRARKAGFKVYALPGTYGVCDTNDFGPRVRGLKGLRKITKPRHLPLKPTMAYYKSMAGPTWPFWYGLLYVKAFLVGY